MSQEHASALPLKYVIGLAVAALAVLGLAALAFHDPGYMDAYYAYHVAANLAAGRGFTEDFIWIYLTNPPSLSHPSHLYWMPLASLLAYPALLLSGEHFRAAQAPFLLLSAAAVVTTALLARQLLPGTFRPLAAALLTLFAGYYFVYWLAVDAFGAFTLAALLAFVATAGLLEEDRPLSRTVLLSALLGLATAAAHLARADGPLLLAACSLVLIASQRRRAPQTWLLPLGIASAAYLLVMLPWFLRNLGVSGAPLPSGGLQTLFLREYNDIFSYGLALDLQHYLGEGWAAILERQSCGRAAEPGRPLWAAILAGTLCRPRLVGATRSSRYARALALRRVALRRHDPPLHLPKQPRGHAPLQRCAAALVEHRRGPGH